MNPFFKIARNQSESFIMIGNAKIQIAGKVRVARLVIGFLAIVLCNQSFTLAQNAIAIRGARLETVGPAGVIEDGTMIIRGGKIEAIGKDVKIPLSAQVIDGKGKTIMPGIVDPYYVVRVGGEAQQTETRQIVIGGRVITIPGGSQAVSTTFTKIADSIDIKRIDWKSAVRNGLTTLHLVAGGYAQSLVVKPVSTESVEVVTNDGKLLLTITNVSQSLDVLRTGLKGPSTGRESGAPAGRPPGPSRPSTGSPSGPTGGPPMGAAPSQSPPPQPEGPTQKLWAEAKEGKSYVYANVNNAASILHTLTATKETSQVKLAFIASGPDLYQVLTELNAKTQAVILAPRIDLVPNTQDRMNVPRILNEKGIPFAFSLSLGQSEFRSQQDTPLFSVGALVRTGLEPKKAMESLTLVPARLLGIEANVGSLEVGKNANFLMLDGGPFEATTSIQRVYVEGKQVYEND